MTGIRLIAALGLLAPLAPATACPWHMGMFGDPGAFAAEPVAGYPADLQPPQAAAPAQPAPSREELMARQRELFLARYPQLAADKPTAPEAEAPAPTANF